MSFQASSASAWSSDVYMLPHISLGVRPENWALMLHHPQLMVKGHPGVMSMPRLLWLAEPVCQAGSETQVIFSEKASAASVGSKSTLNPGGPKTWKRRV